MSEWDLRGQPSGSVPDPIAWVVQCLACFFVLVIAGDGVGVLGPAIVHHAGNIFRHRSYYPDFPHAGLHGALSLAVMIIAALGLATLFIRRDFVRRVVMAGLAVMMCALCVWLNRAIHEGSRYDFVRIMVRYQLNALLPISWTLYLAAQAVLCWRRSDHV